MHTKIRKKVRAGHLDNSLTIQPNLNKQLFTAHIYIYIYINTCVSAYKHTHRYKHIKAVQM